MAVELCMQIDISSQPGADRAFRWTVVLQLPILDVTDVPVTRRVSGAEIRAVPQALGDCHQHFIMIEVFFEDGGRAF